MAEPPKVDVVGILDWFWNHLGPRTTIALLFAAPIAFVAWHVWLAIRKDREANLAIAAKEDTIQRLADENRLYRIQIFKEKFGWTEHQIDTWIIKNEAPEKVKKKK